MTISKQTHSGKSGCLTDETGLSRTPNVNTEDTYHKYEMHTLTSFYVCAIVDLETFHVSYLHSLCPFSGAADENFKEAKRKQKGHHRRLTNDNGHGPFVARVWCRLKS